MNIRQELVGRDAEVALLVECLAAAVEGHPQIVMCRGEPGIGKTRLADELVTRAKAFGALSAWGRASDSIGAPPSWPWRQVLSTLAGVVDVGEIARARGSTQTLRRRPPTCSRSQNARPISRPHRRIASGNSRPSAAFSAMYPGTGHS